MQNRQQNMDRFHRELEEFLDQQNIGEGEDLQKYLDQFIGIYNERIRSGYKSKIDIALERFNNARGIEEKVKRAYGVLKYNPYHFDARWIIEYNKTGNELETYQKLLKEDEIRLEKEGYEKGKYYLIYETREYILKLYEYMELLISYDIFEAAVVIGEKIMRLNQNDNTGARYHLMHLYAYFDETQKAEELFDKSIDHNSCMFLMPMACIAFNYGDMDETERYFKLLLEKNSDARRYLRAMKNNRQYSFLPTEIEDAYARDTWEELYCMFKENQFLYDKNPAFMKWVYQQVALKNKR